MSPTPIPASLSVSYSMMSTSLFLPLLLSSPLYSCLHRNYFLCSPDSVFALILETMLFHCLCLRHCFCSRFYLCLYRCLASVNVPPCMCLSCFVSIPVIALYSCSLFYSAAVPLLTPMTNVPSCPPSCKTCLVASGGQASDLLGRGASATWGREVPGFEVASPGHGKGRR